MSRLRSQYLVLLFAVISLSGNSSLAVDGSALKAAFDIINNPAVEESHALAIKNLTLEAAQMKLHFDSGTFYPFKPVSLDSQTIHFGGYFVGQGRFDFNPPVEMEQDQLRRFFDTDSLNRTFNQAELFFDSTYLRNILEKSAEVPVTNPDGINQAIEEEHEHLTRYHNNFSDFQTLKNLLEVWSGRYLLVNIELNKGDRVLFRLDPTAREEVKLYKHYWEMAYQFFELVCSYHSAISPNYDNVNGINKDEISCLHYDIDAHINDRGKYSGRTDLTFKVNRAATQLLIFYLHPELNVDSVLDSEGKQVLFLRHNKNAGIREQFYELYLFLNRSLNDGDTLKYSFFYEGDIAERDLGEFFVSAGADWYPRVNQEGWYTFDMTFKTPKFFDFTATGNKIEEHIMGDTLLTRWQVNRPTLNISFNIGNMKKYDFNEENTPSVEVHFSREMHQNIGTFLAAEMVPLGKNMEKQVAEDIMNSLRLYAHFFGDYPYEKLVATEVLASHGEAFPGFLHLGFTTWINTDPWGWDRLFRSHEVAHQWWGSNVGYQTYHDQWLSEGFAEYSALMYLQAVSGNDKFLEKLGQYRDDIYSVRNYLFSEGEESGPIALGYRTSSTQTRGDFDLIIYKKGAYVLHMLRNLLIDLKTMNEDLFFQMMKEYYETYKGKEATSKDFQNLTEFYTGIKMDWFFNQWVYGTALPEYDFKYVLEKANDGYYYANCTITQSNVPDGFKMYLPVEIEFPNGKVYIRLLIDKPLYQVKLPPLVEKPKKIKLNPFESVLAKVNQ